ncbi:MAG: MFS transporter, partial [Nitrospinae bacterium]|nr:MFS transporter [Nitrospinota bacterium]
MKKPDRLIKSKMFWVGILYFTEGFPLGAFYDIFPVHFRQQGVDLSKIGFLSLLGLAWTLKFIWAPAIDYYRRHRKWIFTMECLMGLVMLYFAVKLDFGPWVWVAIGLFTLFSATADIAIDAYTIEMLNKNELGFANGLRIGFYRVGMLMAGFILILSDLISWRAAYLLAGLILFCCGAVCLMAPREQNFQTRSERTVLSEFLILVKRPGAIAVVFLLLLSCVWLLDKTVGFSTGNPYVWPAIVIVSGLTIFSGYFISNQKGNQDASFREALNEGPIFGALFELLQRPNVV